MTAFEVKQAKEMATSLSSMAFISSRANRPIDRHITDISRITFVLLATSVPPSSFAA